MMWNLGGREREDAEEVEAGGQRRHRIQKEESTGRLGRFSSLLLAMLLVLVSLPPASPLGSWSRLVTLQGKASGGWTLDVEGTFDPGVNLVAQFDATEFYGSSQQVDTPSTAISSASLLSVTVPQWSYAAGLSRVKIVEASTGTQLAGPGGMDEVVRFTAGWTSRGTSTGIAQGGTSVVINGYGFDAADSDYVCKFVCTFAGCVSGEYSQSIVPRQPASSVQMTCITPLWPYNARVAEVAGAANIVVEKGGVLIPYDGPDAGNPMPTGDDYVYVDRWTSIDASLGLASQGGTTITVSGYGFEPGSNSYSCVFVALSLVPIVRRGSAATAVSSQQLTCDTPLWDAAGAVTNVYIYKMDCEGSRGSAATCLAINLVDLLSGEQQFEFIQAAGSLSAASGPAAAAAPVALTVYGGGFNPSASDYTLTFVHESSGSSMHVDSTSITAITGSSVTFDLPQWGFQPNAVTQVIVNASMGILNTTSGGLEYTFVSSWGSYDDATPTAAGPASGGELITVHGTGFVTSVSRAGFPDSGIADDYKCKFTGVDGRSLASEPVLPTDDGSLVCTTPNWGLTEIASSATLTLLKGDYEYSTPSLTYRFDPSWTLWSSSRGPVSGGAVITVTGSGFNVSAPYSCRFTYNAGQVVEESLTVVPVAASEVRCVTPRWTHYEEGLTSLEVIDQTGYAVFQVAPMGGTLVPASYHFAPGFVVSNETVTLYDGEQKSVSFGADTIPDVDVRVDVVSSDESVALVTSPFMLTAGLETASNVRSMEIKYIAPGTSVISLVPTGGKYKFPAESAVRVTCLARITASPSSATLRSGTSQNFSITVEPPPQGNITLQLSVAEPGMFAVSPSEIVISPSNPAPIVQVSFVGVGSTSLVIAVNSTDGPLIDPLFRWVSLSVPLFGVPGLSIIPPALSLQPLQRTPLILTPDTPPTLKAFVTVTNSQPSALHVPEMLTIPAHSTASRPIDLLHLLPSSIDISLSASSPGLIAQLSSGCEVPAAAACAALFTSYGCSFQGYNGGIGGGTPDAEWDAQMTNISDATGFDCRPYERCFRTACCASADAVRCADAALGLGCALSSLHPPFSAVEDPASDWGLLPLSPASQLAHYASWVPGVQCLPFVPCAWDRCYPGGGNYDGAVSDTSTITTLPGFTVSQETVNLKQGETVTINITLDVPTPDSGIVNVSLSLVRIDGVTEQESPVASLSPSRLTFGQGLPTWVIVSLRWERLGRAGLRFHCDPSSPGLYTIVDYAIPNYVSSSPGLSITAPPATGVAGRLEGSAGGLSLLIPKFSFITLTLSPSWLLTNPLSLTATSTNPAVVTPSTGSELATIQPVMPDGVGGEATVIVEALTSGQAQVVFSDPGGAEDDYVVISSGAGYTPGNVTITGYGGTGFSGTYSVGISSWGYYFASGTARKGRNITSDAGEATWTYTGSVVMGTCYLGAAPVLDSNGTIASHSGGSTIRGCVPTGMIAVIIDGEVEGIQFTSDNCMATGMTCEFAIQPNVNASAMRGYFTTGITEINIGSQGIGYTCDWACYLEFNSLSGLHHVQGAGLLGHRQACPRSIPACSSGYQATAVAAVANRTLLSNSITVRVSALVSLSAQIVTVQVGIPGTVFVTPLEAPTGTVVVRADGANPDVVVSERVLDTSTLVGVPLNLTVNHLGGDARGDSEVMLVGEGEGNYDGLRVSVTVRRLPGFNMSTRSVDLQQYPGHFSVLVAPDTVPNKQTAVNVSVETDFGTDFSKQDLLGGEVLATESSFFIYDGSVQPHTLVLVHGGGSGRLRNLVTGTAVVRMRVTDPLSNYDGIGQGGDELVSTIDVNVMPGFTSNIQDTYRRSLQAFETFQLVLTLDHTPTASGNLSFTSSDPSKANVTAIVEVQAGNVGPYTASVMHLGTPGDAKISVEFQGGGNYERVTAIEYLNLELLPGFVLPDSDGGRSVLIQHQAGMLDMVIGLNDPPTANVRVHITSADPDVVSAAASVSFSSATWVPGPAGYAHIRLKWESVGDTTLDLVAESPGGNYKGAFAYGVPVRALPMLNISRTHAIVQKWGSSEIFVSTPSPVPYPVTFSFTAFPSGVVSVGPPQTVPANSGIQVDTDITHIRSGSATVRVAVSGGQYEGVSFDVSVIAKPGFVASEPDLLMYSCLSSPTCTKRVTLTADEPITSSVEVTVTSSAPSVATVSPENLFLNENVTSFDVDVTYVFPGSTCLSFAATGTGNYDGIHSGGVDITALPDFLVNDFVMQVPNGQASTPSGFIPTAPIIYVQDGSTSQFSIAPTLLPAFGNINVAIEVEGTPGAIIEATPFVTLSVGSMDKQNVTVTHVSYGEVRISLRGSGGNYNGALWDTGILVRALPLLVLDEPTVVVRYRFAYNITVRASVPQTGEVNLTAAFIDPTLGTVDYPMVPLVNGVAVFQIRHINPGFTKVRIVASGANYHNAEVMQVVQLNFPGFDAEPLVVHVQRWAGNMLTGTVRGTNIVSLTPNEQTDSDVRVNADNSDTGITTIESQDGIQNPSATLDQKKYNTYRSDEPKPNTKYYRAKHMGTVGTATITFGSPVSPRWPTVSGCAQLAAVCPGYEEAIYFGVVMPIPEILVILHAGFVVAETDIYLQRLNTATFTLSLDYLPSNLESDVTVFFTSADPSIATVQESVTFQRNGATNLTVEVFNVNPGVTTINCRAVGGGIPYDGAIANGLVTVNCLKGFGLSSIDVRAQSPPTDDGIFQLTMAPDDTLTGDSITVNIVSSNTSQITATSSVSFPVGPSVERTVNLTHINPGSISNPVTISFTIVTTPASNYYFVVIPDIRVVPLGTFVLSQTSIRVQKGMSYDVTVSPSIAPDQEVTIFVTVGNESLVTATQTLTFLARKLDSQVLRVTHAGNVGFTTVSLRSVSIEGNYDGAVLNDAIQVEATIGFTAFTKLQGVSAIVPVSPIDAEYSMNVQYQPTSHLAKIEFLVRPDVPFTADTELEVISSNPLIVSGYAKGGGRLQYGAGEGGFQVVVAQHAGQSGTAVLSFRAISAASGNYFGIESGHVTIRAMPGLEFSTTTIDVQKGGVGTFTIRPGTYPTQDVLVSMITSDPSVATIQPNVTFRADDEIGPANTKTVTVYYVSQGTVAVSFTASSPGGNFDGVIWSNGLVAASRPGFTLSVSSLTIAYDGTAQFTVSPDTVPTADTTVTIVSTQPSKASPEQDTIVFMAGVAATETVTLRSWCSVSPGNCARAGDAVISLLATSIGGNYDGVDNTDVLVVRVTPPAFLLSTTSLLIQASTATASFSVTPAVPPSQITTVGIQSMSTIVATVQPTVVLQQGVVESATVPVTWQGVGITDLHITVPDNGSGIGQSNFVGIDPVTVSVRSMAGFTLSTGNIDLQPGVPLPLTIIPSIEISAPVVVSIALDPPGVAEATPSTITFNPPRRIVGIDVLVQVGTRVVLSEGSQRFPRIGTGTIMEILSDNLDLVSVAWDSLPSLDPEPVPVGLGGVYSLAQYEDISITVSLAQTGPSGATSLGLSAHSADSNYNGATHFDAVAVTAQPSVAVSPEGLTIQYMSSQPFTLSLLEPPSQDMELSISPVPLTITDEAGAQTIVDVLSVTPSTVELRKANGILPANSHSITVTCLSSGITTVQVGGSSGNYANVLYSPITVECLPGFVVSSPNPVGVLAQSVGSTSISISPTDIPDARVTLVVTSSPPGIVDHAPRLFFDPFLHTQSQTLTIRHSGVPTAATASISIVAYGGIYHGATAPHVLNVSVAAPAVILPLTSITVQPTSFAMLPISFDTRPEDPVTVTAVSSDTNVATVNGPLVARDTGGVSFTVTHVTEGSCNISFILSTGNISDSTYSDVAVPTVVSVNAFGPGFLVSATQISLQEMTSQTISVGLDTIPESRVEVTVTPSVPGIVSLSPPKLTYDEWGTLVSTLSITWASPGTTTLAFSSQGGVYHEIMRQALVTVTSLPPKAVAPSSATAVPGGPAGGGIRSIIVYWTPPPTGADVVTGYLVQLSRDSAFATVEATRTAAADDTQSIVAPLVKGGCYYIRVSAINGGGTGPPMEGGAGCITVVEAPTEVSNVSIKALSDTMLLAQWNPPLDSGDGTADGIDILGYLVETLVLATGELHEAHNILPTQLYQELRVSAGTEYMVRIRSYTPLNTSPQPNAALLYIVYDGTVRTYNVPLFINVSPTHLQALVGSSTSLFMVPASAPTIDAVVDVYSTDNDVAQVSSSVTFRAGSPAGQSVIIFHNRVGTATITFVPRGGNYAGLNVQVSIETLQVPV